MKLTRFLSMLAVMAMASFTFVSCEEEDDDNDSNDVIVNKNWRYEYADEDGNKCLLTELTDNGTYFTYSEKYFVVGEQFVVESMVFHYDKNGKVTSIDDIVECSADYIVEELYESVLSYYDSGQCSSIDRNGNTITCKGIVDEDYNNVRTKQDVYDYFNDYLNECLNGSNDEDVWAYEYTDEDGFKRYLTELTDNGTSLSYSEKYQLNVVWYIVTLTFKYDNKGRITGVTTRYELSSEDYAKDVYDELLSNEDFTNVVKNGKIVIAEVAGDIWSDKSAVLKTYESEKKDFSKVK